MLGSLQNAVPILFRHLDAYIDLAEQDLAVAKATALARLQALLLCMVGGAFALLLGCILIIALAWDTDYRILTIVLLTAAFAVVAAIAAMSFARQRHTPFAAVRKEWRTDREVLHRILAQHDRAPENA